MFEVIYEDNHLLVVVKPVNVPAQADSSGDMDMLSLVKAYIKEEYQKPGAVYAGLVHRLDRPAGGLMVFAKTSKAAARLSAQFQSHEAGRSYLAAVEGDAGAGTLTDYLCKDGRKNRVMVVREGTAGAKWARLCYETVERRGGLSLVRVELSTGRPHQIRVQMANAGFPLFGDQRYGRGRPGQQLALWGAELRLIHPTREESMTFRTPLPKTEPWIQFKWKG